MGTSFILTFEEYALLVEQAPIMIWRANPAKACDYFNRQWLLFTGRTLEQERGNGWAEGVHPDDFQRCLDIYVGAFDRREVFEMEYRLRRYDGAYRWIFDRGVPFNGIDGRFAGYIGSCIDITERVEAREQMAALKEKEINDLRRLLPVCASCKRIRDEQGQWQEVDAYLQGHSSKELTHALCPACMAQAVTGRK